ncbi:uncharacterized protein LOC117566074 [Drosophila albomicans]|uniref:Uncharacterized protein LOC117566074 n=1 Tax=Drosophila albomicans TaxID=7291 RepID=A0A6P8WCS1_DROAB|nr:uncharacterized protein LOC117566074 [Drosophila albomicans]
MQTPAAITASAPSGSNVSGDSAAAPLRACSTSGCRVSKYVELTKRKCAQFVSLPYIMPKPLVVNGKTSIFQVGGEMAKMGDIPSLAAAAASGNGQPIYRIKPGTHAHVINYVFIDEGSDSMEKAKSEDQEAMRMLIDSQRESATAKLQKLITTHRGVGPTTVSATVTPAIPAPAVAKPTVVSNTNIATISTNSIVTNMQSSTYKHVTTPQIHPDLSIASVAGALPRAAAPPLVIAPAPSTASTSKPAAISGSQSNQNVLKLQAEILKLQRTVAQLGGAAPR